MQPLIEIPLSVSTDSKNEAHFKQQVEIPRGTAISISVRLPDLAISGPSRIAIAFGKDVLAMGETEGFVGFRTRALAVEQASNLLSVNIRGEKPDQTISGKILVHDETDPRARDAALLGTLPFEYQGKSDANGKASFSTQSFKTDSVLKQIRVRNYIPCDAMNYKVNIVLNVDGQEHALDERSTSGCIECAPIDVPGDARGTEYEVSLTLTDFTKNVPRIGGLVYVDFQ